MMFDRMPLNGDSASTESQREFCLALKAARERKGISLDQIAEATKVPASLFAALERSDLRRWPRGLFRRSFFRDYVRAIGLPVAEACDEFRRLFPEDTRATVSQTDGSTTAEIEQVADVRLSFDTTWHGPHVPLASRLRIALLDGVVVVTLSAAVWIAFGLPLPSAIAIIALAYFSGATALLGETPANWFRVRRRSIFQPLSRMTTAAAATWPRTIDLLSSVIGKPRTEGNETPETSELRPWMSDAHRVEPALSSRLRVRIKMFQ